MGRPSKKTKNAPTEIEQLAVDPLPDRLSPA